MTYTTHHFLNVTPWIRWWPMQHVTFCNVAQLHGYDGDACNTLLSQYSTAARIRWWRAVQHDRDNSLHIRVSFLCTAPLFFATPGSIPFLRDMISHSTNTKISSWEGKHGGQYQQTAVSRSDNPEKRRWHRTDTLPRVRQLYDKIVLCTSWRSVFVHKTTKTLFF